MGVSLSVYPFIPRYPQFRPPDDSYFSYDYFCKTNHSGRPTSIGIGQHRECTLIILFGSKSCRESLMPKREYCLALMYLLCRGYDRILRDKILHMYICTKILNFCLCLGYTDICRLCHQAKPGQNSKFF